MSDARKIVVDNPKPPHRKPGRPKGSKNKPQRTVDKPIAELVPSAAPMEPAELTVLVEGPIVRRGELYFSTHDRLVYDNEQLEYRCAAQAVELRKNQIVRFKQEMEARLEAAVKELQQLEAAAEGQKSQLLKTQQSLEQSYGISFENITYDRYTGRILIEGKPVQRDG